MYNKLYPWLLVARLGKIPLYVRLELSFDKEALISECLEVLKVFEFSQHYDVYHSGGWSSISLRSCDGSAANDRPSSDGSYLDSELMLITPELKKFISNFPSKAARVRLMNLPSNDTIFWHFDKGESLDDGDLVRLHIPIVTGDKVFFQLNHQDCRWKTGEVYYGDFSFPHRLSNNEDFDRIHLVLDFENCPEMEVIVGDQFMAARSKRLRARYFAQYFWRIYNIQFILKRMFDRVRSSL